MFLFGWRDIMSIQDTLQDERLSDLENRLRLVESAVVELGVMTKFVKYGVLVIAASFGLDLSELI